MEHPLLEISGIAAHCLTDIIVTPRAEEKHSMMTVIDGLFSQSRITLHIVAICMSTLLLCTRAYSVPVLYSANFELLQSHRSSAFIGRHNHNLRMT